MPKRKTDGFMAAVGSWAFIIGVLLAVFASLTGFDQGTTLLVLGLLGLLVGFLNIAEHETVPFLVATIAIMSAAGALSSALTNLLRVLPLGSELIPSVLAYVVAFVAPAAGVVAIKTIWELSKSAG